MFNAIQAYLILLTSHSYCLLDKKKHDIRLDKQDKEEPKEQLEFAKEITKKILERYNHINIKKNKLKYDEFQKDDECYIRRCYNRLYHSLTKENGIWFDKNNNKQEQKLFNYISKKYNNTLNRCPLYTNLLNKGKIFNNDFKNFVKLKSFKDSLGRSQHMKEVSIKDIIGENNEPDVTTMNFRYIRQSYLKKLLLCYFTLYNKKDLYKADYLGSDFNFYFVKSIFENRVNPNDVMINYKNKREKIKTNINDIVLDSMAQSSTMCSEAIDKEIPKKIIKRIPKNICSMEAELISIYGGTFGVVSISPFILSFKSKPRKTGEKYVFGTNNYSQYDISMCKKWDFKYICEIVTKRYNLINQAVEVYFSDFHSVLFSFFNDKYQQRFINCVREYSKKSKVKVKIVDQIERIITIKSYVEKWKHWKISNFEYLMVLNKYAGRSFNDISQYPVFPWVISDYDSRKINLSDPKIFRNFKWSIGGISDGKRTRAKLKYDILSGEYADTPPFQLGSHYLPSRIVLGYMMRMEPFASLLIKFENGVDSTSRMFHEISRQWSCCLNNEGDNRELIPEFFYLPEFFANYNKYSFGLKNMEEVPRDIHDGQMIRVGIGATTLKKNRERTQKGNKA